jgi:hypothetical protein
MVKRVGFRKFRKGEQEIIEARIKEILHASRDGMRNRNEDTTTLAFTIRCSYWGEAAGILRGLEALGYGYYGSCNLNAIEEHKSDNPKANFSWWLHQLEQEVLEEEHFYSDHHCEWCMKKYKKDSRMFLLVTPSIDELLNS